jgi:hypothetical protein
LSVRRGIVEQVVGDVKTEGRRLSPARDQSLCFIRSEKDQSTFYELDPVKGLAKELQTFRLSPPDGIAVSRDGVRVAALFARQPAKLAVLDLSGVAADFIDSL